MPPASRYQSEINQVWLKVIEKALEVKRADYLREADMCERYYVGDQTDIYTDQFTKDIGMFSEERTSLQAGTDGNAGRYPRWRIRDNAAGKLVQIFSPFLLSGEIVSTVKANKPFIPPPTMFGIVGDINTPTPVPPRGNAQAMAAYVQNEMAKQQYMMIEQQASVEYTQRSFRAAVLDAMINYSIKECALKDESRTCLRDSLVRGAGFLNTELINLPNGTGRLVSSNYLCDDNVVIDPDATRFKNAKWVAILCEHPAYEVADMYAPYGITEDMLHADRISHTGSASTWNSRPHDTRRNNLFQYWKVFSRCGMGTRLKSFNERTEEMVQIDQTLGDYVYLVVSHGSDYPLNMTPYIEQMAMQSQSIQPFQVATSWPWPSYYDMDDPWPFTALWFHERKNSPWPVAHLSFAIGYLNFMVWVLGFMAEKAYRDSRGVWVIDSSVTSEFESWLQNGMDEEYLKFNRGHEGKSIKELIEYIKGPDFDGGLIDLYLFMERKFEQITGMTDVLQATFDKQMRSAHEAQVVENASRLRPDDMTAKMQAFLARVTRKQAIASRWLLTGEDMVTILGQYGAMAWDQSIRTQDVRELFRESTFNVETGKGRPLDIQSDLDNINQAMQFVFPAFMQYYQTTGDPSQLNAVIAAWCKARQMDPAPLMFPALQMLPPNAQDTAADAAAQAEADKRKAKEQARK